jgi:hypothetical protein
MTPRLLRPEEVNEVRDFVKTTLPGTALVACLVDHSDAQDELLKTLEARVKALEADNAALEAALLDISGRCKALEEAKATLWDDSLEGLAFWHGNACSMRGGAYPYNAAECEDVKCRDWAERLHAMKGADQRMMLLTRFVEGLSMLLLNYSTRM